MKDAKKRIFLINTLRYLPAASLISLMYPTYRFMQSSGGSAKQIKINENSITNDVTKLDGFFLVREKNDFKAFSSKCTHLGCTLNYDSLRQRFVCPCHKSEFALDGSVLKNPALKPLAKAYIKKDGNYLVIKL